MDDGDAYQRLLTDGICEQDLKPNTSRSIKLDDLSQKSGKLSGGQKKSASSWRCTAFWSQL
jgi:hypothetical protein